MALHLKEKESAPVLRDCPLVCPPVLCEHLTKGSCAWTGSVSPKHNTNDADKIIVDSWKVV
uniref:Uncharacterized protein n=1 Tax=viral metagenome TaxID=1070528 RepID=A0A6C0C0M1_9ZZZZ